jgi:hypothetical protein
MNPGFGSVRFNASLACGYRCCCAEMKFAFARSMSPLASKIMPRTSK